MPQPLWVQQAAEDLAGLYAQAERRLLERYVQILGDPARTRETARLRELIRQVDTELGRLDQATRQWFHDVLPAVWAGGGASAASGAFTWTPEHRVEVQALAGRTYDDLLANTRYAGASLKRAVRDSVARDTARSIIDGTTTPDRAAQDTARTVQAETGASTVRYSNGARHSLADYTDTALRTTTALAYADGALIQMVGEGVTYALVIDGPACGWTSHDDTDLANGSVRPLVECQAQTLSHPRCARSFSPEPAVRTRAQARDATPPTEDRQAAAQAERQRAAEAPVRLSVDRQAQLAQRRDARTPRAPRRARAAPV